MTREDLHSVRPDELDVRVFDETAALYCLGRLVLVGTELDVWEKACKMLGVRRVYGDAFLLGQISWPRVAKTLDEIDEFVKMRGDKVAKAANLRDRAAEMLREAEALDPTD